MKRWGRRWILFLLAVVVGVAGGIGYGWLVNPVKYSETHPDTLGLDYQTDYVLMVAEIFQAEGDVDKVVERLTFLNPDSLQTLLQTTLTHAIDLNYAPGDIHSMQVLTAALEAVRKRQP